jgi:hypothetical protein
MIHLKMGGRWVSGCRRFFVDERCKDCNVPAQHDENTENTAEKVAR